MLPIELLASTSLINIHAEGAVGKQAFLIKKSDFISSRSVWLAETIVDEQATAEFQININTTILVDIQVDFKSFQIVVEPGKTYDIRFKKDNYLRSSYKYNVLFQKPTLELEEFKDSLNEHLIEFNQFYSDYVSDNYIHLYINKYQFALDSLYAGINDRMNSYRHPYYLSYLKSMKAHFDHLYRKKSLQKLVTEFFESPNFEYENVGFTNLFLELFDQHLTTSLLYDQSVLREMIYNGASYSKITDYIGKDPLLRNQLVRDLVFLNGLREIRNMPDYHQGRVTQLLFEFKKYSPYSKHQEIAANLLYQLNRFEKGYLLPEYQLKDSEGNTYERFNFNGKYTYYVAIHTQSPSSLAEMKLIQDEYLKVKDYLNLVYLCFDDDPANIYHFLNSGDYEGVFLFVGDEYRLQNELNLISWPNFMFVDKQGQWINYHALSPSKDFFSYFNHLISQQDKNE